jgi:starch-binding outer membrane protein SusE/F
MKYLSKIIFTIFAVTFLLTACKKEGALPNYAESTAPVLSASKSIIAPTAADSSAEVVTLSWSNPMLSADSAQKMYIVEIDSAGRNFAKSVKKVLYGSLNKVFTGKELNAILVEFGFKFNIAYDINVRVTSSYKNFNDTKVSNIIKLSATAYRVPPKVALPTSDRLFIVGGASTFGWGNSTTIDAGEEFAKLDETTWAGVFYLNSGGEYLVLPVKGAWSHKYSIKNKFLAGVSDGGDFDYDLNDNFPAPANSGWYRVTMDFQSGRFLVEPFTGPNLPTDLFIVGDATPASWNNPATGPTVQQLTKMNSCVWEMPTIAITGGKEYLVLPVAGSWSNKYSVANKSLTGLAEGGDFGYNFNDNFPAPAVSGNYKISLNFATAKFKTTKL